MLINKILFYWLFSITFYQSIYSHLFYSLWITILFISSFKELYTYKKNNYCKVLLLLYIFIFYNILFNIGRGTVLLIFLNNLFSKVIQSYGNYLGTDSIFSFTFYTYEAFLAGIIFTQHIFDLGNEYILYNFLGILSSISFDYFKYKLEIEWNSIKFNNVSCNVFLPLIFISIFPKQ